MTDLTHQQAHALIQQPVLAEVDRTALRQHLVGCPDCRAYAAMHVRLMQELPLPAARSQPTFAQRAAIRAAAERARPAPRATRPLVSLAGLAALSLIIAAAWLLGRGGQGATLSPPAPVATLLAPFQPAPTPDPRGRYVVATVPAPSLAGNTIGEPLQQQAVIYLPPSYDATDRRYPVVYVLFPGLGTDVNRLETLASYVRGAMNLTIQNVPDSEMIVVAPNSTNVLNAANLFVDSPVAGNWPAYISSDLVSYVDAHYRTLATPESRGIIGVDCTALGVLQTALDHPGVYKAMYLMNPLLHAPGTLDQSAYFSPIARSAVVDLRLELADLSPEEARSRIRDALDRAGGFIPVVAQEALAYGIAFAPTTDAAAPYFEYPFAGREGAADPTVLRRWEAGQADILGRLQPDAAALRGLAIAISDVEGTASFLLPTQDEGVAHLREQLAAAAIPHDFRRVDMTDIEELGREGFPFLARSLAGQPPAN